MFCSVLAAAREQRPSIEIESTTYTHTLAPLAAARRITSLHTEMFLAIDGVLHICATAASISTDKKSAQAQWFKSREEGVKARLLCFLCRPIPRPRHWVLG
jgi:hypothetical protein